MTRLDSLTGARFVAAVGVFLFHATGVFPAEGPFGRALAFVGGNGAIGVDFFFALSGFVLAWSWRPGGSVRAFYRRRFARLAPAYWIALLYGLAWVIVLYGSPAVAALHAIPAAVGLQAWFPDPAVHFAADGVEWSVSAELFFYALFPLLIGAMRSRGGRRTVGAAGIVLGCIAPYLLRLFVSGNVGGWLLDIFPVVRLGEFMCGLLLAVALKTGRRVPIGPRTAFAAFLLCYVLVPMAPAWVPRRAIFLAAILLVIASLAQVDLRGTRTVMASKVPVRLGEWSYCFYLVHQMTTQVALFLCARVVSAGALGPLWLVTALALSILLAALLYYIVERPFERRLRGAQRPRVILQPDGPPLRRDVAPA
jgi:peptidoglycan/LPS O-acetylase OafA/YrhL